MFWWRGWTSARIPSRFWEYWIWQPYPNVTHRHFELWWPEIWCRRHLNMIWLNYTYMVWAFLWKFNWMINYFLLNEYYTSYNHHFPIVVLRSHFSILLPRKSHAPFPIFQGIWFRSSSKIVSIFSGPSGAWLSGTDSICSTLLAWWCSWARSCWRSYAFAAIFGLCWKFSPAFPNFTGIYPWNSTLGAASAIFDLPPATAVYYRSTPFDHWSYSSQIKYYFPPGAYFH